MRVNYNTAAFVSASCLRRSENRLDSAIERLSTGLKINHGKDNPSGLAVARRMNLQIRGLGSASDNAKTGQSIIETADGALSEIHDILQRINELSVQGATGTVTDEDRTAIMDEVNQMKQEITRIANNTDFNGQTLLDGSFDLKGYTNQVGVDVASYSDSVKEGTYKVEIDIDRLMAVTDKDKDLIDQTPSVLKATDCTKNSTGTAMDQTAGYKAFFDKDANKLTIEGQDGFSIELEIDPDLKNKNNNNKDIEIELDIMGIGAMTMQVGANEGQMLEMRIPKVSLESIGIANIDLSTQDGALDALSRMNDAIDFISSVRGRLGAYQNRLEHTEKSLDCTEENMTASYSRIMDLDMAEEMTEYSSMQVLTQAGTTMVAQANQRPSQVLQLLQ